MQALARAICRAGNGGSSSKITHLRSSTVNPVIANARLSATAPFSTNSNINEQLPLENRMVNRRFFSVPQTMIRSCLRNTESNRYMATEAQRVEDSEGENVSPVAEPAPRIKFKRLDKTAKHIMSILDTEEVEKVRTEKEILDIRPGCIVELKVEVPENKRRVSTVKGIVIARRNAGLNTTFRLRRLVAGVGVESVYPLYSPNIKAMKIIDRKKVRRAKLYYLRDRMNALKK